MKEEIIISGFGGQGVLSMGKLLAYAAMMEGKEVSWLPAYGPEQRGGTANCTVIVSDNKIPSPVISSFTTAILLNQPSIEKFMPCIKPGGILIYEYSGIIAPPENDNLDIYEMNAMDTAAEMQNSKTFNMIVLGGLIKVTHLVSVENVRKALYKTLPERHHKLIPINEEALLKGMEIIRKD